MSIATVIASIGSGAIVGLILGLIGGGGSVLAVPLLLYVVGLGDTHMALGTSAVAVMISALVNLGIHARAGGVKWRCAALFAAVGVVGAVAGARIALMVDGRHLLIAFAGAMAAVAIAMLRRPGRSGNPAVGLDHAIAMRLLPVGFGTGLASGFFGIGGGFLVVPGLMFASGMPIANAISSSLLVVAAFGAATAATYAAASQVDWPIALIFVAGGLIGGVTGVAAGRRLGRTGRGLTIGFAAVLLALSVYVAFRALSWT